MQYKNYSHKTQDERYFLMGIAIISIMLFHQTWLVGDIFDFLKNYGHWGVDVFVFLSGYGIAHSLQKNSTSKYCKNRIARLLPTCIVMGGVSLVFDYMMNNSSTFTISDIIIKGLCLNHWFIPAIITYYCISPFLNRISTCQYKMILIIGLLIVLYILHDIISWPFNWTIERFPIYCVGFYLYRRKLSAKWAYILGLSSLIAISSLITCGVLNSGNWLTYIIIIPGIIMLSSFIGRLTRYMDHQYLLMPKSFIQICGQISLQLYLGHSIVYNVVNHYYPGYVGVRLFVLAIGCSWILSYMVYSLTERIILYFHK